MRWLFLLLVVLNGVYYVWHQQEAPLKVKEVAPLSLYKGNQQDIRLLSESHPGKHAPERGQECLYVGGMNTQEQLDALRQRLLSLDVAAIPVVGRLGDATGLWLQIAPQSQRLLDQTLLGTLSHDFKDLKHKIMLCRGIATGE
ncbi:hypothetical protein D3C76_1106200 [compost metagenome]|jgi:hypothetical protein|uniref:Sporulation domain-containing protein n=1 Tax=Pseudomonas alkylphenolica TaxID=237609 RepID=A0A6I6GN31_9PSED|nr:hypothetical protein [Pseudomonas alkylphenolica]QGW75710.1 hypothetical protein GPJ81_03115 [Pseudomonas alkylphenolica]